MQLIILYVLSLCTLLLFSKNPITDIFGIVYALILAFCLILVLKRFQKRWISYPLFFSISITSLFGFTKVLTGSHAESTLVYFYGLSFYTASLAFLNFNQKINFNHLWKVTNPLLLFTGPIVLFLNQIKKGLVRRRLKHYLPFLIIGIFYFQVIGAPLSTFMPLINSTDIISVLLFAFIFEIFVYTNFCGLSLIIYSVFGLLGYKIPLNFKQPFSSSNVIEFWQGWHITLSSVLKDLFYTPVRKRFGVFFALIAVFISSAMWHGVTINFLIWGLLHAISFYITLLLLRSEMHQKKLFTIFILFFGVIFGRLIFAESNYYVLIEKLSFNYEGWQALNMLSGVPMLPKVALFLGISLILIEFIFQNNSLVSKRTYKHLRTPFAQIILCIITLLLVRYVGGDYAIYGQR